MKRFNIFLVLLILLACIIPIQAAPPTQYKEVSTSGTDLKGKVFVNSDATGFTCGMEDGIITMSGHGTKEVKLKWIALKSSVKGVSNTVKVQHRNDAGVIDSTTTYDFDSMQDSQGFVYFTAEFSEVIIGGYVGTWSVSGYNLTTKDTLNSGQEYNGSDVRYVNASVTDNSVKSNPYDINESGLVGWWKLDDDYLDSSSNGNNGTVYGDTYFVNGKYNNGSDFDGVGDYVNAGNDASLNITDEITIEAWVKTSTSGDFIISAKHNGSTDGAYYLGMVSTDLRLVIINSASERVNLDRTFNYYDNNWHHIVGIYDGLNMYLYADGLLLSPGLSQTGLIKIYSTEVNIGAYGKGAGWFFNGYIDDARIYNRALSAIEIQNNYYDHLQQLQINTTANSTYSTVWNSTANNPISIPFGASELFNGLKFKVPETVVQDGITIYDYHNTTRFDITADIGVENDIIKISETAANGLYSLNVTHTPTNSGSGYINYTTTNTVLLNADFTNPATLTTDNVNATMTASGANFNISTGYVSSGVEYYYIVNQYYFYAPTNLGETETTQTSINYSWTATPNADKYSVYLQSDSMVYTATPITIDGIKDTAWDDVYSHIIPTPNPLVYTDYDTISIQHDNNYVYAMAEMKDADAFTNDDYAELYFDFTNNGLTTDDRAWKMNENGDIQRLKWSGSAWISAGVTQADSASTGAGTNNIIVEMRIPIALFDGNIYEGSIIAALAERECTGVNPAIESYHPIANINNTDVSLWDHIYVTNETEYFVFIANTTNTYYNITGLDYFEWYRAGITAWNGTQETSQAHDIAITQNIPLWSVSGYVKDADGVPVSNVVVWFKDSFVTDRTTTNTTGYYERHMSDDDYTVYANKTRYIQNSINITVFGADLTNQNITLPMVTNADIYQLLLDIQDEIGTGGTEQDLQSSAIPIDIFIVLIIVSFILMLYAFLYTDYNNYTHIISALLSTLLNFIIALNAYNGITKLMSAGSYINEVVYQSVAISTVFTILGIIMMLIAVAKIYDVVTLAGSEIKW